MVTRVFSSFFGGGNPFLFIGFILEFEIYKITLYTRSRGDDIRLFGIMAISVGVSIFLFSFLFSIKKFDDNLYTNDEENVYDGYEKSDDNDFIELLQSGKSLVRVIGVVLIIVGLFLYFI